MTVQDYLIDPSPFDWAALLRPWGDLLPAEVTVWLVNRFGDLFLAFADGSVQRLDLEAGELGRLADDRDEFCRLIDSDDNAADWLLVPLVDRLVAAGTTLGPGRCYHFKTPTVLGGEWAVENIGTVPLAERLSFLADLHDQLKDLPDGKQVELRVIDDAGTGRGDYTAERDQLLAGLTLDQVVADITRRKQG